MHKGCPGTGGGAGGNDNGFFEIQYSFHLISVILMILYNKIPHHISKTANILQCIIITGGSWKPDNILEERSIFYGKQ